MPRQNRVTPQGEIVAAPERGTFLGNRGVLHDGQGRIVRPWAGKRWLVCLVQFKGRKRQPMQPGRYTELFFLDEATDLSAGHRPCAECRRGRFRDFRLAWAQGNLPAVSPPPSATALDERLHADRVRPDRSRLTFDAELDGLPDGCLVLLDSRPWLVRGGSLLAWSPGGYGERRERPAGVQVSVFTPRSTVGAMRAGYVPAVHPSAW